MPLTYKVDTLDGIEEAHKGLYKQDGDQYVLEVDGLPQQEDVSGLKSALQKERQYHEEADKQIKAWKKLGESPDAVTKQIQELEKGRGDPTEQEKMIKQLNEQNEALKTGFASERKELEAKAASATEKAHGLIAKTNLVSALHKAGFTKAGVDLLPLTQIDRIRISEKDGKMVTDILTKDLSSPMIGSGENVQATYDDLAAELAKSYPDLVESNRKSGGGKPPGSGGSGSNDKTITRAEFDAMSPGAKAKSMSDGFTVTDG